MYSVQEAVWAATAASAQHAQVADTAPVGYRILDATEGATTRATFGAVEGRRTATVRAWDWTWDTSASEASTAARIP